MSTHVDNRFIPQVFAAPDPGVFGDWEPGLEVAERPMAPVRQYTVTDEMRRKDAAERAAREAAIGSGWKLKQQLGRVVPIAPAHKPVEVSRPRPVVRAEVARVPVPGVVQRIVAEVEFPDDRDPNDEDEFSYPPLKRLPDPFPVEIPDVPDQADPPAIAAIDERVPDVAECSSGCGRLLNRKLSRARGFCGNCWNRSRRTCKYPGTEQKCSHEGCDKMLRTGKKRREDGLCGYHGELAAKRGPNGSWQALKQRVGKTCELCGRLIDPKATKARCQRHIHTKLKVVLTAGSMDEHQINQVWAGMGPADRFAVLGEAVGA